MILKWLNGLIPIISMLLSFSSIHEVCHDEKENVESNFNEINCEIVEFLSDREGMKRSPRISRRNTIDHNLLQHQWTISLRRSDHEFLQKFIVYNHDNKLHVVERLPDWQRMSDTSVR